MLCTSDKKYAKVRSAGKAAKVSLSTAVIAVGSNLAGDMDVYKSMLIAYMLFVIEALYTTMGEISCASLKQYLKENGIDIATQGKKGAQK